VTDKVRALRQGEPTGVGTVDVGAVIFPPQLDIVDEHVRDAVAKGAKVLTGGHAHADRGRYYEPTVLVDVDHSMRLMQEETFGPTLPIMKIANPEEGVRLANDSAYGLQASVWTSDADRGEELARRIEAGVVCVNDAQINYSALNLPMGGWKTSGVGTRHGANGIRKYTKTQSLMVTRRAPFKREPFMFPYKPRQTMLLRRPRVQIGDPGLVRVIGAHGGARVGGCTGDRGQRRPPLDEREREPLPAVAVPAQDRRLLEADGSHGGAERARDARHPGELTAADRRQWRGLALPAGPVPHLNDGPRLRRADRADEGFRAHEGFTSSGMGRADRDAERRRRAGQ
jgi:hypothetical protein